MIPFRTIASLLSSHAVSGCAFASVGRPARVAEAGGGDGAVRAGGLLEVVEIPDRAHVLQSVVLEQRYPRRVVAPVLEALQTLDEQRLGRPAADVSDDPAHPEPPSLKPP